MRCLIAMRAVALTLRGALRGALLGALLGGGCAHPRPAPVVVARPGPVTHAPAAAAVSPWPVPMRVMTWTPEGVIQVGELPGAPPKSLPSTPWYVEPTRTLDQAMWHRVVAAVREEHVPGLSLRGQPIAPWLHELHELPELVALILDDTAVDAAALDALDLPLHRLYLARTHIDDSAIGKLASRPALAGLEVLDLEDCAIGDPTVQLLRAFPELRALNLAGTRITDAGGAQLGRLTKLSILDLGGTPVGARTIAALRPLAIRELFLDGTRVGKEIATLAAFAPGLVRFEASSLAAYKPTDGDVGWLAGAPNLVEAGLSGSRVHDKLVLALAALPHLREIRIAGTPITLDAVKAVAARRDLEEVDLAETPVDDASAAALLAMPRMRVLRLDRTAITDAALKVTPSPVVVELYLSRTAVSDVGLEVLAATPKLEALGLGETQVGDATITRVARLSALRTLVLSQLRSSREILVELGALHELERLYLDTTRADDTTLAALGKLRELKVLHLANTDVSQDALPVLRGFTQLEELTIGDTRMHGEIANLDAWPHLRTLSVSGLELGDDALPVLARRMSLVTLDLTGTDVHDPAALTKLPRLRVLGLVGTKLSPQGLASANALAARGVNVIR
ncbi:MAG: leucine-rich repeat domain protein [Deltaproteobacteria bacterium]|nr:leucine-rich repeat domain protein [Deltaproteobacteria bacterium]